jgi:hypothetical protein
LDRTAIPFDSRIALTLHELGVCLRSGRFPPTGQGEGLQTGALERSFHDGGIPKLDQQTLFLQYIFSSPWQVKQHGIPLTLPNGYYRQRIRSEESAPPFTRFGLERG